ncbi:MAG: COP23 domain-containing protein [Cyanobacteria bacterium J06623_7]
MKTKSIPILFAAGAMAIASGAVAHAVDTPELNFSCQVRDGVHTTIAQSVDGRAEIPIFLWKAAALDGKAADSPEELCGLVSQKLADLSVDYDISNINFIGTHQADIPMVCANTGGSECSSVLFTLNKTNDRAGFVAGDVVDAILAQDLQPEKQEFRTRGVQSISYQVDFWSLLGLKFSNKY